MPTAASKIVKYLQNIDRLVVSTSVPMAKDAQDLRQLILTLATMVHEDLIPSFKQLHVSRHFIFTLYTIRSTMNGGEAICLLPAKIGASKTQVQKMRLTG